MYTKTRNQVSTPKPQSSEPDFTGTHETPHVEVPPREKWLSQGHPPQNSAPESASDLPKPANNPEPIAKSDAENGHRFGDRSAKNYQDGAFGGGFQGRIASWVPPVLPNLNQGWLPGPDSEWVDEPPFAPKLRAFYDAMIESARLYHGAKKQYDLTPRKPTRYEPNPEQPTYTLVGGPLDAEAMYRLDIEYLSLLRSLAYLCKEQGFTREACWLRERYHMRRRAMAEAMLPEVRELLDRYAKSEVRFAQAWPSPEVEQKAQAALAGIVNRLALLYGRVEQLCPSLLVGLITEQGGAA